MKRQLIAIIAVTLGVSVAPLALAQGRHDEKPHGMMKTEAVDKDKTATEATTGAGGRHDEKPHGMKKSKAKAKKPETKAAAEPAATPEAKKAGQ